MRKWWLIAAAAAIAVVAMAQSTGGPGMGVVSSQAALQAIAPGQYTQVWLMGYATLGDAPPVAYLWAASCPGAPDGGAYLPPAAGGGGCWSMLLQTAYDVRWWGQTGQPHFVANNSTGTTATSSFCVPATPCKSINQTLATALKFDLANLGAEIEIQNTGTIYTESVAINGPGRGYSGTAAWTDTRVLPLITFTGTGSPAPIVNNNASYCYTMLVNSGAHAALGGNIQIEATNGSCVGTSALYSQFGGTWYNSGPGTILGPAPNGNLWIGEENGYFVNMSGCGASCDGWLTFTGNAATSAINSTDNSGFESDPRIAITGTPSYGRIFWASMGGYIKLPSAGGPFTAGAAVAAGTPRFLLQSGGRLQVNATWPTGSIYGQTDSTASYFQSGEPAPCAGGAGCSATTAPTGLGTGGAASMVAGASVRTGNVKFVVGASGALASGTVYVGFPWLLTGGNCWAQWVNGSAALQPGATIVTQGGLNTSTFNSPSIYFLWNDLSTPLPAGSTQYITYQCQSS